jgi:hypothetical protein
LRAPFRTSGVGIKTPPDGFKAPQHFFLRHLFYAFRDDARCNPRVPKPSQLSGSSRLTPR